MQVRWTDGLKAGEVAEVEDHLGLDFVRSGKAVRLDVEPETPERKPGRRKAAAPDLETR